MAKIMLFDIMGMVIKREMRFSERFSKDFNVPMEKLLPFFNNELQLCLVGKADLKEELKKYLPAWQWKGSVDDLLEYWFSHESNVDQKILDSIKELRNLGIQCFLNTQNEKYIVDYVMNTVGLKKHFDGIFCTNQIGFKKSQNEYWETIHKLLNNPDKQNVLCWDDEEKSVQAAKQFGFDAQLYTGLAEFENKIKNKQLI